jgi:hypothetical protein
MKLAALIEFCPSGGELLPCDVRVTVQRLFAPRSVFGERDLTACGSTSRSDRCHRQEQMKLIYGGLEELRVMTVKGPGFVIARVNQ